MLLEAIFWLPLTRVIIQLIPMGWYAPLLLGKHMAETPHEEYGVTTVIKIKQIAWTTQLISNYMPWQHKCYALAITSKLMLRFRGLKTTLYLGVRRNDQKNLKAHAWLRCGSIFVTGGNGSDLAIVSTFAD